MNFGLTKQQLDFIFKEVCVPLGELKQTVWCYGSRARGDHQTFSDLDLMVEGELTKQVQQKISSIKESVSNSNFPFKIDLVHINDFAQSYNKDYEKEKKLFT